MSRGQASRFVLAQPAGDARDAVPDTSRLQASAAVAAARFWMGKSAPTRKADAIAGVARAMKDKARAAELIAGMRAEERTVLAVVERYGGTIDGALLRAELLARGIIFDIARESGRSVRSYDPVRPLRERLLLLAPDDYYEGYSSWGERFAYPTLMLAAGARGVVAPAAAPPWKRSAAPAEAPASSERRHAAEWMLELEQVASVLASFGRFKINQGGSLPAPLRARIAKAAPLLAVDTPMGIPDAIDLAFLTLIQLGVIDARSDGTAEIAMARLHEHLSAPPVAQAQAWIRSWIATTLWRDGAGALRGSASSMSAYENSRAAHRRLVVWALSRVAVSGPGWLDLEAFLLDLQQSASRAMLLYAVGCAWRPAFAGARDKDALPRGVERDRAFWLDNTGTWIANMILISLHHLGLVERATSGRAGSPAAAKGHADEPARWCFRLTDLGGAALGAPDIGAPDIAEESASTGASSRSTTQSERRSPTRSKEGPPAAPASDTPPLRLGCLTVQPNFDVLLYTDAATAGSVIATLGRLTEPSSGAGPVRTYRLTRASVCRALDAGIALRAALELLARESRSPVPDNVLQSMSDWARKRDSLVLRRGSSTRAAQTRPPPFTVSEEGLVIVRDGEQLDLVSRARLARICTEDPPGTFTIGRSSVARARDLGIAPAQIIGWLGGEAAIPPILRIAIDRWSSPARSKAEATVALEELLVLRVLDDKLEEALATSKRIAPLLAGAIAPGWLVVHASKRSALDSALEEIGIDVASSIHVPACTPSAHPNAPPPGAEDLDALLSIVGRRRGRDARWTRSRG